MRALIVFGVLLSTSAAAQPFPAAAPGTPSSGPSHRRVPARPTAAAARPSPTSAPAAARGAGAARPVEMRFDAIRIDGQLHGPEALVVRSLVGGKMPQLVRLRRSFMQRTLRTVDDPCLLP